MREPTAGDFAILRSMLLQSRAIVARKTATVVHWDVADILPVIENWLATLKATGPA